MVPSGHDSDRPPTLSRDLLPGIERLFALSAGKDSGNRADAGIQPTAPRCSRSMRTLSRRAAGRSGPQGFQFGSALLQFDATGEREFLELGRSTHDRARWRRISRTWRPRPRLQQRQHLRDAVAPRARRPVRRRRVGGARSTSSRCSVSGAVQARRWTPPAGRRVHLLVQRRALALRRHRFARCGRSRSASVLGHRLLEEQDAAGQPARAAGAARPRDGRLQRLLTAADAIAPDVRVASRTKSLFNAANGTFRGPSTQQGYSPFTHVDARPRLGDARLR